MKSRDVKELHTKTVEELTKLLVDARETKRAAALELSQLKAKNMKQFSNTRKEIAQLLTILKEKEHANGKNA